MLSTEPLLGKGNLTNLEPKAEVLEHPNPTQAIVCSVLGISGLQTVPNVLSVRILSRGSDDHCLNILIPPPLETIILVWQQQNSNFFFSQ